MVDLQWEDIIPENYPDGSIKFRSVGYVEIKEIRYDLVEMIIERCYMWDWLDLKIYNKKIISEDCMDVFKSIRLGDANEFNSNFSEVFKDIISETKEVTEHIYIIPKELSRILKIENVLND